MFTSPSKIKMPFIHVCRPRSSEAAIGAALSLAAVVTQPVRAATVTFDFSGTVSSTTGSGSDLNSLIQAGSPYTASFTFDPSTSAIVSTNPPDRTDPSPHQVFRYQGLNSTINIGNFSGQNFTADLFVTDSPTTFNPYSRGYAFVANSSYAANQFQSEVSFSIPSLTSTAFPSTLSVSTDTFSRLSLYFLNFSDDFNASGTITSVTTTTAVPEPSGVEGALLLGTSIAGYMLKHKLKIRNLQLK